MEPAFCLKHFEGKQKSRHGSGTSSDPSFPSSAYHYLKHVKDEASKCPDIVVADVDYSHFDVNQDSVTVPDSLSNTTNDLKASGEWQHQQVTAFSEIRQFLVRHQALAKKQKMKTQNISLPSVANESEWKDFCFGQETDNNDLDDSTGKIEAELFKNVDQLILDFDTQDDMILQQPSVLTVLDYHISWLETRPFTLLQGQWIYALLAAVEKPLLADTTYSLRCLARLCSQQREKLIKILISEQRHSLRNELIPDLTSRQKFYSGPFKFL